MEDNKKTPQVVGTTSEDKKNNGITIQVSDSMLSPLYENISIAKEIIEFSNDRGWSEEQLLMAIKIITSVTTTSEKKTNDHSVVSKPYQDGIANVVTGRKKYQEPITSGEIEHDYQYLQSVLSKYDIGRLKHAVKIGKPIIVEGIQGPTGKTTLIRYLRERGAKAIQYDLSEVFTLNEHLKTIDSQPFKSLL